MKQISALLLLVVALTLPGFAHAVDVDGKWGLSAPVLSGSANQFSLIRGTERGAWILDVDILILSRNEEEDDTINNPDTQAEIEQGFGEIGPRLRFYTRADQDLSPYYDVFVHGFFQRSSNSTVDRTTPANSNSSSFTSTGIVIGTGFGVELFTKWGFSGAIDTRLAAFRYTNTRQQTNFIFSSLNRTGNEIQFDLEVQPRLYVRGYW